MLTTAPLVAALGMRLIDRWDHIFSVNNNSEDGRVGSVLGVLPCFTNDTLILRKIVSVSNGRVYF